MYQRRVKAPELDSVDSGRGVALLLFAAVVLAGCALREETLEIGLTPEQHDIRAFPISDEHPATASHRGLSCEECHASGPSFEQNQCVACHAALPFGLSPFERHRLVGGFEVSTPLCKRCHAENQLDRVNAHEPFALNEGAPHHLEGCLNCHVRDRDDKVWATDFTHTDCRGCHEVLEMADVHEVTIPEYISYDRPRCISCHRTGILSADGIFVDAGPAG